MFPRQKFAGLQARSAASGIRKAAIAGADFVRRASGLRLASDRAEHAAAQPMLIEHLEHRRLLSAAPLYRVNAGGPGLSETPEWSADSSATPSPYTNALAAGSKTFASGATVSTSHPSVPAGTPASVFQTERFDGGGTPMQWDFPVAAGKYDVRLYLAETHAKSQVIGGRTFHVAAESVTVLKDLDVYAEVGANTGLVKTFTVGVTDGTLDLDFVKRVQNPSIKGIEILPHVTANRLGVSAHSVAFGSVTAGETATRTVTLTNLGQAGEPNITLNSTVITGAAQFGDSFDDAAPVTLAPGESTTVTISFAPDSLADYSSTLAVHHSGDNSPLLVPLAGTGSPPHPAPVGIAPTADEPSTAMLTADVTDDGLPTGQQITTQWGVVSGPGGVKFSNPAAADTTASFSDVGTYVLRLTANDGTATGMDDVTVTVTWPAPVNGIVYRVNAGGTLVTAAPDWLADTAKAPSLFSNAAVAASEVLTGTNPIDLTHASVPAGTPMSVFQAERFDRGGTGMEWNFPVEPGEYEVRLYLAETYLGAQKVGGRVFDVAVDGALALDNYDIFADVGADRGVVKRFAVSNTDGNIDVDFFKLVQNPSVRGIEIVRTVKANTLEVVPSSLDFGNVVAGQTASRTLTLTNLGAGGDPDITVDATDVVGAGADAFSDSFDDAGSLTLAPGQSAVITVTFAPVAFEPRAATLQLTHSGTNAVSVALAGVGTDPSRPNEAPSVNAGPDVSVALGSSLMLSGTIADDGLPVAGALTSQWTLTSGPGSVTFADATAASTTASFSATGTYVLTLTATDGALSVSDSLAVTVSPTGTISFGKSTLSGTSSSKPTSLQFGPDGRLYVAQQSGHIKVYTIVKNGANSYAVTATETIDLIYKIPNHNDDGMPNPGVKSRLVTGLIVSGTAAAPVIYAVSSDPRIGGGASGEDKNLDTNSGVLSRLTKAGGVWTKLDLVRGLPRSEENHTSNGLELDPATNTLYIAQGGHTNMGAPSNNFALLPEYALSAAILSVDLDAIGFDTYDLPTLDDEARPGADDGGDPFGGNDGKNQARLVSGGAVQVFAPGFRNPYDVVITQSGRMYSVDNGGNAGWGDVPVDAGGVVTTPDTAGQATNDVHEPGVTHSDQLHLITGAGYYGGHPNPTRANQANTFNPSNPQSAVDLANPVEGSYLTPGTADGALALFPDSTNGLTEYTAGNFAGAMAGDLLTSGHDNKIYRIKLTSDGTGVVKSEVLFTAVGRCAARRHRSGRRPALRRHRVELRLVDLKNHGGRAGRGRRPGRPRPEPRRGQRRLQQRGRDRQRNQRALRGRPPDRLGFRPDLGPQRPERRQRRPRGRRRCVRARPAERARHEPAGAVHVGE